MAIQHCPILSLSTTASGLADALVEPIWIFQLRL
jgi:hypothetical protein